MGLFSGIAKAVRGIFRGIRKVFAPILEPLGKFFGSKWGKIILIAAAVFTAGMALYAGWAAAAATQGTMMTKFLAGSKAFIGAVLNPVGAAKGALKGTGVFAKGAQISGPSAFGWTSGGADAALLAGEAAGGAAGAAGGAAAGAQAGPGTVLTEGGQMSASVADAGAAGGSGYGGMFGGGSGGGTAQTAAQAGAQAVDKSAYGNLYQQVGGTASAEGAGLLTKSGELVKGMGRSFSRFGKSTGGGLLMSNMMQGYSQGKIAEKYEEDRAAREAMWSDSPELDRLREVSQRRLRAPENWSGSGPQADPGMLWRIRQGYSHQPPIPYRSGG